MGYTIKQMLIFCINAITDGTKFTDSRGIVYKQEFGQAFVDEIKKALEADKKLKED